jgi:putative tryptophan/tyrosine transport system substrate-binding protein
LTAAKRGAKSGDLPIEHVSRYVFVVNLKTAKTLGIRIPQNMLLMADSVIS